MEHFVTVCAPVLGRRKPVYRVVVSASAPEYVMPCATPEYMWIPTDRIIQRGAIINPTRELKRYLRAKQTAELMDIWRTRHSQIVEVWNRRAGACPELGHGYGL